MNRFTLPLLFLLVFLTASPAHAVVDDVIARWNDKTLPDALKQKLLEPGIWHRVATGLEGFNPRPQPPLTLRSACAANVDSAYYRELEQRGAIITRSKDCTKTILWAAEGDTGLTFTYEELLKKYLPMDTEAEAASFLFATGYGSNSGWYGATVDGRIYLIAEDLLCNGYARVRKIFVFNTGNRPVMIGTVTEPAPKSSGCTVH